MDSADSDFDAWLDDRLRAVPVPAGMCGRLREIAIADDGDLDTLVRDVPVPSELQRKLERIGREPVPLARLGQTAVTASLLTAVAFSYLGAVLAFLLSAYRPPDAPPPRLIELETIGGTFSAFRQGIGAPEEISRFTFGVPPDRASAMAGEHGHKASNPFLEAKSSPSERGGLHGFPAACAYSVWLGRDDLRSTLPTGCT